MRLPDPRRSRLVLIGTSEYEDEKLSDLPAVGRSVDDLATALTDPFYGLVPKEHCTVLTNEGDIRLIGRGLRLAARQAEDLLLVYYAGHGLVGGRRHDLYLALPESEWVEPEFNSLEYDKLRSAVLDSPASTKVIILDCCFSGRVVTDTMTDPVSEIIGQAEVAGTYVLASAHRDQVALVLPGENHTAFTGRLLGLLNNGVPGGPEFLTIDDLYRQLLTKMKAEGLSYPQKRGTATADLLALARNRAYAATAARVPAAVRPSALSPEPAGEAGHPGAREQPQESTIDIGLDVPRPPKKPPAARAQEDSPAPLRRPQAQLQSRGEASSPGQRPPSADSAPVGVSLRDLFPLLGVSEDERAEAAAGRRAQRPEAGARRRAERRPAEKRLMPLTWSVRASAWLLMLASISLVREYYAHYTGLIVLEVMLASMSALIAMFAKFARGTTAMIAFTSFCVADVASISMAIHKWSPFVTVPMLLFGWVFGIVGTMGGAEEDPVTTYTAESSRYQPLTSRTGNRGED